MKTAQYEYLAGLPTELQVELLANAAKVTEPRSVRGDTAGRFSVGKCGLSRKAMHAMMKHGHGEKIHTGSHAHAYAVFFPLEILVLAAESGQTNHGRIALAMAAAA